MNKKTTRSRQPKPTITPIANALRDAIRASGWTQAELSRRTGVNQPAISVFMNGGSLMLDTAERLALALNLQLKPRNGVKE